MRNTTIRCKISLSKKIRALLKDNDVGSIVLTADVENGKGFGVLSITGAIDETCSDISEVGETSIQVTPIDYSDETPNNESIPQGTIFSTIPKKGEKSPVVDRMAAVNAPDAGEESNSVVSRDDIRTPEAFSHVNDKDCKKWISNLEELIEAVSKSRKKKSDIDPDMASNDRE